MPTRRLRRGLGRPNKHRRVDPIVPGLRIPAESGNQNRIQQTIVKRLHQRCPCHSSSQRVRLHERRIVELQLTTSWGGLHAWHKKRLPKAMQVPMDYRSGYQCKGISQQLGSRICQGSVWHPRSSKTKRGFCLRANHQTTFLLQNQRAPWKKVCLWLCCRVRGQRKGIWETKNKRSRYRTLPINA